MPWLEPVKKTLPLWISKLWTNGIRATLEILTGGKNWTFNEVLFWPMNWSITHANWAGMFLTTSRALAVQGITLTKVTKQKVLKVDKCSIWNIIVPIRYKWVIYVQLKTIEINWDQLKSIKSNLDQLRAIKNKKDKLGSVKISKDSDQLEIGLIRKDRVLGQIGSIWTNEVK